MQTGNKDHDTIKMAKKKKEVKKRVSFLEVITIIGKILSVLISVIFLMVFLLFFIGIFGIGANELETGNVAVIQIEGTITTTGSDSIMSTGTKSDDIIKLIDKAEEEKGIKAILFEINSPGGGPVASDEIASAIKRAEKPTVSLIREIGASGGFWVATAADKVYANRMSITGSIGATSSKLAFPGLIHDYNVTYRRLVAGEHKDAGSIWRALTPDERKMFEEELKSVQEEFIKAVAENRDMDFEEVKKHADGFIFSGREAYENGFVDELGNREDVKKYLEELLKTDVKFKTFKVKKGLADMLTGVISENSYNIGKGIGSGFVGEEEKTKISV